VNLVAGSNVTITPSGNNLTISATGGGGDGSIDGSGTANYVPLFTGATTLGNSAIYQTDGNIGIGNITPIGKLHVERHSNYAGYFTSDSLSNTTHVIHAEFTYPYDAPYTNPTAVYGKAYTSDHGYTGGFGGRFEGGLYGVLGSSFSGVSFDGGCGVRGEASGNGFKTGVEGYASVSGTNYGIKGWAGGEGGWGENYGIYGSASGGQTNWAGYFEGNVSVKSDESTSPHHVLHSEFTGTGTYNAAGVYGQSVPADGYGFGGIFEGGYRGVQGSCNGGAFAGGGYGVYGYSFGTAGTRYGVYGSASGGATNYGVYASGDLAYTGTLFGPPSDTKLKQNINSFSSIQKISQLEPITFTYTSDNQYNQMNLPSGVHYGLIAQELEKVFPELVVDAVHPSATSVDGEIVGEEIHYKSIKYMELVPILIQAVKEQQKIIGELTKRIGALESK